MNLVIFTVSGEKYFIDNVGEIPLKAWFQNQDAFITAKDVLGRDVLVLTARVESVQRRNQ